MWESFIFLPSEEPACGGACVCLSVHSEEGRHGILNNRNKHISWILFISAWSKRHMVLSAPLCVTLTVAAWLTTWLISHELVLFFCPLVFRRQSIRSLLNVNMLRAGQQGDRETDEGVLKGPMCVYVCTGWPLGRVLHHFSKSSICSVLQGNLPARCGATSLTTPNSSTSTYWPTLTQRSHTFTSHDQACCKQERSTLWVFPLGWEHAFFASKKMKMRINLSKLKKEMLQKRYTELVTSDTLNLLSDPSFDVLLVKLVLEKL